MIIEYTILFMFGIIILIASMSVFTNYETYFNSVSVNDQLTAIGEYVGTNVIKLAETGPGEVRLRDLPSDKEDFLLAIKSGKPTLEPLETAHRTISMCQLGLISIKTGSKLTWISDAFCTPAVDSAVPDAAVVTDAAVRDTAWTDAGIICPWTIWQVYGDTRVICTASIFVLFFESHSPDASITTGGDSIWWAVVTITTVGYGDYYPVTLGGRITGVFVMFSGVGIIGALASILASLLVGGAPAEEEEETPLAEPVLTTEQELAAIKAELVTLLDRAAALADPEVAVDDPVDRRHLADDDRCRTQRSRGGGARRRVLPFRAQLRPVRPAHSAARGREHRSDQGAVQ